MKQGDRMTEQPLRFAEGEAATAEHILRLDDAGILSAGDDLRAAIVVAADLEAAEQAAGRHHTSLDRRSFDAEARDAVHEAAKAGEPIAEAAGSAWRGEQERQQAWSAYQATKSAAGLAAREVHGIVRHRVTRWGEELSVALDALLADAAGPAAVMAGATFDYGDPNAAASADKRTREAFDALLPLAEKHDAIREAAALLAGVSPGWADVAAFGGYGLEQWRPVSSSDPTWRWRPQGHAVDRVVKASADQEEAAA